MPDVLISWIGNADLNGLNQPGQPGPLVELLQHQDFDEICVMDYQPAAKGAGVVGTLKDRLPSAITEVKAKLRFQRSKNINDNFLSLSQKAFSGEL